MKGIHAIGVPHGPTQSLTRICKIDTQVSSRILETLESLLRFLQGTPIRNHHQARFRGGMFLGMGRVPKGASKGSSCRFLRHTTLPHSSAKNPLGKLMMTNLGTLFVEA